LGPHATSKEVLNAVTGIARTYFSKVLREETQNEYIRNPGASKASMHYEIELTVKKLLAQVEKQRCSQQV
jgi:hypothetical protein